MSFVLACDLGGTNLRAALLGADGRIAAGHMLAAPSPRSRLGRDEIDPDAWWTAFLALAGALAAAAPAAFAAVEGIAICGVTRTQVFLGRDGRIARPAMTWRDTRAEDGITALRARLPADHPETGSVNAFHPLARLDWLSRQEPEALAAIGTVLDPKDYLNFRLTGVAASDPVSMARLLAAATPGPDGSSLLGAAGLPGTLLPPMREPAEAVGAVRPGLPAPLDQLAGRPVFAGSNDTWTAVTGLGAQRPGFAYNISGTTEVFGLMAAGPIAAEGLLTVDWRGAFQLGGPGQNGADTVAWLLGLVGQGNAPTGAAIDALLAGPRDSQPLLFLPYLQGERVPYWDTALRGAFVGLNRRHAATDLAWAVLEGVAFLNRIVLERAEAATGLKAFEIRFAGGAARNPAWCQVKADICGRPVAVGEAAEPGLFGAATLAWTGLGRFPDLASAQQALVRIAHRYAPDSARAAHYDALYAQYRAAEAALAPISRGLAAMTNPARTEAGPA